MMKRGLSLLFVVALIASMFVIPSEALYSDYRSHWNAATSDSEMGRYVANVAKAQDTKTRDDLGYAGAWCAKFAMDCGEIAGTTALNPPSTGTHDNTWTPDYYANLLAAGGKEVSTSDARAGDIAFFDMNGHDGIDHVEIVYDVKDGIVYTVGGNTGRSPGKVNKRTIPGSARDVQGNITNIVRPNYYTVTGDVNGNGKVTVADAQVIINAVLGKDVALTAEQNAVADVNRDGRVTVADAQQIINDVLGK